MAKRPATTQRTQRALRQSCFEILADGKRASVTNIVERAHCDRSTFYSYYANVADLIEDQMLEIADEFYDVWYALPATKQECVEMISAVYERNNLALRVLLQEPYSAQFTAIMKRTMRPILLQLRDQDQHEHQKNQKNVEATQQLQAAIMFNGIMDMIREWYASGQQQSMQSLGNAFYDVLVANQYLDIK